MMRDQEHVCAVFKDTLSVLCRNELAFRSNIRIQGLLGITVDDSEVFLIQIDECLGAQDALKRQVDKLQRSRVSPLGGIKPISTRSDDPSSMSSSIITSSNPRYGSSSGDDSFSIRDLITVSRPNEADRNSVFAMDSGPGAPPGYPAPPSCQRSDDFSAPNFDSFGAILDCSAQSGGGAGGGSDHSMVDSYASTLIGTALTEITELSRSDVGGGQQGIWQANRGPIYRPSTAQRTPPDRGVSLQDYGPSHSSSMSSPLKPAGCGKQRRCRTKRPRRRRCQPCTSNAGDEAPLILVRSVHECGYANCGKQFLHKRHLLRHQTLKHGRQPVRSHNDRSTNSVAAPIHLSAVHAAAVSAISNAPFHPAAISSTPPSSFAVAPTTAFSSAGAIAFAATSNVAPPGGPT